MYLTVKALFHDKGMPAPELRDYTINLNDVDVYFDWQPAKGFTAVHIRGSALHDFPSWLHVSMPFAEFDALFKSKVGQSAEPDDNGLPFPTL